MTAPQWVTLVLDRTDATGRVITHGAAAISPSGELPVPEQMLIGMSPVVAEFGRRPSPPAVTLASTDSVTPVNGWTYNISFPGVTGDPQPFSFALPYANGATQYLSQLARTPAMAPGEPYVPSSGGTMTGPLTPAVYDLPFSPVVSIDVAAGQAEGANVYQLVLTGNCTISAPSGAGDGFLLRLRLVQGGSGGHLVTWGTGWDWGLAGPPQLSAAPGARDRVVGEYVAYAGAWDAAADLGH